MNSPHFSFLNSLHLECNGKCFSIFVFTQGSPVHLVVVNRDFPPFAVLLVFFSPASAEQAAGHKVLVQNIIVGYPIITVLHIVDIGTVVFVLPAVILTIIIYGSFACAAAFPRSDYVAAIIVIYLNKGYGIFNSFRISSFRVIRELLIRSKYTVTYACDI